LLGAAGVVFSGLMLFFYLRDYWLLLHTLSSLTAGSATLLHDTGYLSHMLIFKEVTLLLTTFGLLLKTIATMAKVLWVFLD
jgi:hypothetical protein